MSNAEHLRVIDGPDGSSPGTPPDPLVGQTIDGRYHVEAVLGEGGMGLVYRAKHAILNKPLAIKVLRPEVSRDEEIITRFRQEAQSASAIGNQHIIDISDFGTLPDRSTYFVMEYLDGRDLSGAIEDDNPMDPARAVRIAKQLCLALGAAHDAGIVHRDLKPDNVYLIRRGGHSDFVKVLDFGIAKVGTGTQRLTKAGQVFGTPHYMSPEQCSGSGVDHRTDIYAMGVILYEMCCGQVPFDADNLMGVLTKHMYEQPVPPHELPPPVNVSAAMEAVILKALTKNADQRYQTTAEMFADLDKVEQGVTPDAVVEAVERGSHTGLAAKQTLTGSGLAMSIGLPDHHAKKKPLLIASAVVAALAVFGLSLFFFLRNGSDAVEAEATPPTEPTEAAPPPVAPAAAAPEVEENNENVQQSGSMDSVIVTLRSDPSGVEVWRDGELLGNTPFDLPRPTGDVREELLLRRAGYTEQQIRISSLTAESVLITLERARRGRRVAKRAAGRATMRTTREPTPRAAPAKQPAAPTMRPARAPSVSQSEVIDPWSQQ